MLRFIFLLGLQENCKLRLHTLFNLYQAAVRWISTQLRLFTIVTYGNAKKETSKNFGIPGIILLRSKMYSNLHKNSNTDLIF
ncbi:hypothetical protein OUZ56_009570 [Daphnia magna]|uniref:Uncharacterized protein n=1 Tax=Daphnia magna TaxID=35525 RepID=A0ABR0AGC8_9CRUS|nr:hypothetical protein OUZ56_009570 [Daphnia magna]